MSASSALPRSAGSHTEPVVAAIVSHSDLPLVLVAAALAERRRAPLALINVKVPRSHRRVVPRTILAPAPSAAARGCDPGVALRDRALTLALLAGVEVTWLSAVGYPDDVVARFCRDNRAALIVMGASRRRLATWRRARVLAAARRLKRRAHTPIHIVAT